MPTTLCARAALLCVVFGLVACQDYRAVRAIREDGGESLITEDAGDGGEEDAGQEDAGPDAGMDGGLDGGRPGCMPGIQYVFTFSGDRTLRRFDPPNLRFETVGTLACRADSPFSMAVDRSGQAWVEYADGNIFKVNTTTASCERTPFVPRALGMAFSNFGMGFAALDPNSPDDALFVSDVFGTGLAIIDTQTYQLTPIGPYQGLMGSGLTNRAELTGTGDGRLYGGFEGMPFQLAEIDQGTATIISQAGLSPLNINTNAGTNFALAAFGSDFWLFYGPGSGSTNIYRYTPATGRTDLMMRVSFAIVGAGVSTCASQ